MVPISWVATCRDSMPVIFKSVAHAFDFCCCGRPLCSFATIHPKSVSKALLPASPSLRLHTQYMYNSKRIKLNSIPFQRDIKDLFTFSFFFTVYKSCTYSIYSAVTNKIRCPTDRSCKSTYDDQAFPPVTINPISPATSM